MISELEIRHVRNGVATYSKLPGYDEISEVIHMAKHSEQGLDAARRILTQLAHKALKVSEANYHYRLYQVALEDIGERFNHAHPVPLDRKKIRKNRMVVYPLG